jgi:hypothetical protein
MDAQRSESSYIFFPFGVPVQLELVQIRIANPVYGTFQACPDLRIARIYVLF